MYSVFQSPAGQSVLILVLILPTFRLPSAALTSFHFFQLARTSSFQFRHHFFLFYSYSSFSCFSFFLFFSSLYLFVVFVCSTDVSDFISISSCHTYSSIPACVFLCMCVCLCMCIFKCVLALLSMDATSNFPFRCIDKYFLCMHSPCHVIPSSFISRSRFPSLLFSNTLSFSLALTSCIFVSVCFAFISQPTLYVPPIVSFKLLRLVPLKLVLQWIYSVSYMAD